MVGSQQKFIIVLQQSLIFLSPRWLRRVIKKKPSESEAGPHTGPLTDPRPGRLAGARADFLRHGKGTGGVTAVYRRDDD